MEWLAVEMEKASKDNLPIFVISHWPINQTHGLPETWGDEDMEPDDGGIGDQSAAVEEILKKQAAGFAEIVKSAGGDAEAALKLLIADKLEDLMRVQVDAIKNIKREWN